MSILSGRKAYLPLEHGVEHKVTMVGYTIRENSPEVATASNLGTVTFHYEVVGTKQPIVDNRQVPSGTDMLAREFLQQFEHITPGIDQESLFNQLVSTEQPISMWMTTRIFNEVSYNNPVFKKPAQVTAEASPATTQRPSAPSPADLEIPFK